MSLKCEEGLDSACRKHGGFNVAGRAVLPALCIRATLQKHNSRSSSPDGIARNGPGANQVHRTDNVKQ